MNTSRHPSVGELEALASPSATSAETRRLAEHLFGCPSCWNKATQTLLLLERACSRGFEDRSLAAQVERDPSLSALVARFRIERKALVERLVAQAVLGNIKPLKQKARREALSRQRVEKTRALVDELLAEARRSLPLEAEEWSSLALLVAEQLGPNEYAETVRADAKGECCVELASARRRSARWKAAGQAIAEGRRFAASGSGSPAVEGMFLAVEGAIEDDLGNLAVADEKLQSARACFEAADERYLLTRTLIQLGYIWMDADPSKSLSYIRAVEPLIGPDEKRLQILAGSTRIDCLITLGQVAEALRLYMELSEIWDQFSDPFFQLRRRFMAGRLLEGEGRLEEADAVFREVIAVDLEQRSAKALYLDLIYVFGSYIRRGDFASACQICDEALSQLEYLELDDSSERQMRELWTGLRSRAGEQVVGEALLIRSRRFIRNQWRTQAADPLATKESAV